MKRFFKGDVAEIWFRLWFCIQARARAASSLLGPARTSSNHSEALACMQNHNLNLILATSPFAPKRPISHLYRPILKWNKSSLRWKMRLSSILSNTVQLNNEMKKVVGPQKNIFAHKTLFTSNSSRHCSNPEFSLSIYS